MNKRLQQFLAAENISQSQFADSIGVARASISHILAGRNKPGFDFIERMARQYPELNLEWLITGRGRMYNSQKSAPEAPLGPITPLPNPAAETLFEPTEKQAETASYNPFSVPDGFNDHLDNRSQQIIHQRTISKIIVFYSDGSFQEIL